MTFLVEDGTGLEAATAYIAVATADTYFSNLGNEAWPDLSTGEKEIAIQKATAYADARWGKALNGRPEFRIQSLEFPRVQVYDRYGRLITGVPIKWERAIAEYSLIAFAGELYPPAQSSAKEIKKKKVKIGPITTESEFLGVASSTSYLPFPLADSYARLFTRRLNSTVIRA